MTGYPEVVRARSRLLGSYLREGVNFGRMTSKRVNRKASRRIASGTCAASGNVHHTCMRASPQCRNSRASAAHPCTAPCARRCRPTTQCDSRTGFKLPSVVHRPVHTVRQRPVHSEQQLATAVHTIAARAVAADCATAAHSCRTFSSPPASTAVCILCPSLHSTVHTAAWGRVQVESRTSFTLPLVLHHTGSNPRAS